MPPSLRLAVALTALALLAACQPEPEAKYAKDLNSCELLPREEARRVTDVGPKLGPPEQKTFITDKYCQWTYQQERDHFWSAYRKGPVKRQLTVHLQVTSAKSGGATAVASQYGGHLDTERKAASAVQEVPGIGEAAFVATKKLYEDGTQITEVVFRRSNALVTVGLIGRDCCPRRGDETEMQAANRQEIAVAVAKAADQALRSR